MSPMTNFMLKYGTSLHKSIILDRLKSKDIVEGLHFKFWTFSLYNTLLLCDTWDLS